MTQENIHCAPKMCMQMFITAVGAGNIPTLEITQMHINRRRINEMWHIHTGNLLRMQMNHNYAQQYAQFYRQKFG